MYRVMMRQGWNGSEQLVHADVGSSRRFLTGKISKSVGNYDTFDGTLDPSQAAFGTLRPFQTFLRVIRPDKKRELFEGRVLTIQPAMSEDGTVTEEFSAMGLEDFLHDSVQPWHEYHNVSPKAFLQSLIVEHNKQVESYKHMKLGTVTVTNSTDNVYRYTDDTKDTYDTIKDKLIDRLGGEIRVRHESDGLYLDYMPEVSQKSGQNIRLSSNLMSITQKIDPSEVISVLKPLGATEERANDETDTTETSTPRLTITSVNSGSPFLRDQNLIDEFGIQTAAKTWDEVKTASILLQRGKDWLAKQKPIKEQIQLNAVDLSIIYKSVDDFVNGNYYHVINPLLSYDKLPRIISQSIDICDPKSSTLAAGDMLLSQENYTSQLEKAANQSKLNAEYYKSVVSGYSKQIADLKNDATKYQSDTAKQINELYAKIKELEGGQSGGYYSGLIIDVSEWQGVIDWAKVAAAGLALPIIRVQYGSTHQDYKYAENIYKCLNAGHTNYAVYAYFVGRSTSDAQQEAKDFYSRTQTVTSGKAQPQFYMIDVEETTMDNMRAGVEAYMSQLNALGIPDNKIVLYVANHLYDSFNLNVARAAAVVVPSYGTNDGTVSGSTKPTHPYDLWQYTSTGSVSGISGNVDLNTDSSTRFKENFLNK